MISLVPWLAVTGLFLSVRRRQMIRIEFFLDQFSPPVAAQRSRCLAASSSARRCWPGSPGSASTTSRPSAAIRTPYLALPKGLFTSALWLGAAAVALAFGGAAWRERRGRW